MEEKENQLAALFPSVAAQMRSALSNLYLAAGQLAPTAAREQDPVLDQKAACLDQSFYQLMRLVNHLSMAACLTEEYHPKLQNTDLVEFVGKWSEKMASAATVLDVKVRFVCAKDRLICAVDPDGLRLILDNLMSNALKFTPAGGQVAVELKASAGRVLLQVTDTGCGISDERKETLFDRYLHENQLDPQVHGLGLGLPLCCRLAEVQEGTLVLADSKIGQGSKFVLSLPLRQVSGGVSDVPFSLTVGGLNRTLMALADALPAKSFLARYLD